MGTKIYQYILTIGLMLAASCQLVAADFTLKGKVVDEDGNGLELASVTCPAQGRLTMTNLKGEFNISLQSSDSVFVKFSMVGYKTRSRKFINPRGNLTVQIILYQQDALQDVTITERRRQTTGTEQLDIKDIKNIYASLNWYPFPKYFKNLKNFNKNIEKLLPIHTK